MITTQQCILGNVHRVVCAKLRYSLKKRCFVVLCYEAFGVIQALNVHIVEAGLSGVAFVA